MGVAEFRKEMLRKKKAAAAAAAATVRAAPSRVTLRRADGGPVHDVHLDAGGALDMARVEAVFGLTDAYLETEAGGMVVGPPAPGGAYIVKGDDALPPLAVVPGRRVGFGCAVDAALRHAPRDDATHQHPERPERVAAALHSVEADDVYAHLTLLHPSQLAGERYREVAQLPGAPAHHLAPHTARYYPYSLYAAARPARAASQPREPHADADAHRLLAAVRSVHDERLVRRVLPNLLRYPLRVYHSTTRTPVADGGSTWAAAIGCDGTWSVPQDTYSNEHTADAVRESLQLAVRACDLLCAGVLDAGFCLVRPPGHHCTCGQVQGFCWVNNAAVCARYLQMRAGEAADAAARPRVAIVDFDVHHGDGTQHIFEDDPSVLFISLHRHDAGRFYPHTGSAREVGTGAGKGYSVNIAFDTTAHTQRVIGDTAFAVAVDECIAPLLAAWQPEHLLVSAGFDAAERDPLGRMSVVHGFHYMTARLAQVVPSTLLLLEGGYHPASVAKGVVGCLRALAGAPPPPFRTCPEQCDWARRTIAATASAHIDAQSPLAHVHRTIRDRVEAALPREPAANHT